MTLSTSLAVLVVLSSLLCGFEATFLESLMPGAALPGPICVGQSSLSQGSCRLPADCKAAAGFLDGTQACPLPAGSACCVPSVKCGASANLNNTAFSNAGYPNSTSETSQCSITINILNPLVKLLRLDFDEFVIAQPNSNGECAQDKLIIDGAADQQGVLPLCGDLTGQHLYIQIAEGRNKVVVQIITSGAGERTWFVRAAMIEDTNPTLPPAGCRQYFWGKLEGKFSSLNFNGNGTTKSTLAGAKYAACFRSEAGYCRLQFEPETFKLAPHQRTERDAEPGNYYGQPAAQPWQPMQPAQHGYQPQPAHSAYPAPAQPSHPQYQQPIQPSYQSPPMNQAEPAKPIMPLPAGEPTSTSAPNATVNGTNPSPIPAEGSQTPANCVGRDRIGLPPSKQESSDRSIFCNDDFNGGKSYPASEAPFNVYYESATGNRHGLGFILKYTHLVC